MAKLVWIAAIALCAALAHAKPKDDLIYLVRQIRATGFPHTAMVKDNGAKMRTCANLTSQKKRLNAQEAISKCYLDAYNKAAGGAGTKAAVIAAGDWPTRTGTTV